MANPKTDGPDLHEVMTGVDMIGTMLHIELPKIENRLKGIEGHLTTLAQQPRSPGNSIDLADLSAAIRELRDMAESQERHIAALDIRLARLAEPPRRDTE
jgi:hypothetical protein